MSDFFRDNKLGKLISRAAVTLFLAVFASGTMYALANFLLDRLSLEGRWRVIACVVTASFLPWYVFLGEIDKRRRWRQWDDFDERSGTAIRKWPTHWVSGCKPFTSGASAPAGNSGSTTRQGRNTSWWT